MSAQFSRLWILAVGLFVGLFFSTTGFGQTASDAALQSGRAWLETRVQADGQVEFEDAAIALPDQTRMETALALRALNALPLPLSDAIAATAPDATEAKARRALVLVAASRADTSSAGQIEAMQNADGGYGAFAGRESSVLDTAWALQALAKSANVNATKAGQALAWLAAAKLADGGFGENGQSDAYTSAQVLLAASAWSSRFATGATAGAARDFLLAQRDARGSFGDTFIDATALLALAGATSDSAVLAPLQDGLIQQQGADGSWFADPYQTALALRALRFATAPPALPVTASVSARVIDDAGGAPIGGVLAQIVETPNASFVTGADGAFTLDGIAAGSATLRVSRLGYERLDFALSLTAGQAVSMGDIRLRAAPLTATIFGVVRQANGGSPLANVLVAVGTASVLTDANGAYELAGIPSGSVTITVSAPGYQSVSQGLDIDAGIRYAFSPSLFFVSQTPPVTATLRGKVVDAQSNLPITGADVTVAGAIRTTLADGKFEFVGLDAGAFEISIVAPTYDALTATGSTVVGVNDIGAMALTKTPLASTLVGRVVDALNGVPVASATLVVQGQTATTLSGPDGRYSLGGIMGTSFTLVTTAPGFLGNTLLVGLPQVGVNTLDIPLTALQDVGIRINSTSTDKPVYAPGEELELEIEVINSTAAALEMRVSADVRDEDGDVVHSFKANAQGLGSDPPNLPLSFAPNAIRELELDWMLNRLPAGIYTIHAQGVDGNGRVLAEGTTRFTLDAAAVLAGGVIADPPLTQVGTGAPVQLSAELTNVGNLPIPAGQLKLQVLLENADTQTSTAPKVAVTEAVTGAPLNNAQDLVRGPSGDYFAINRNDQNIIRIDSQNDASVFANLPACVSCDSLAVDAAGILYAASSSSRVISRVSPDGVIGTISLKYVTRVFDLDVAADGTIFANGRFSGVQDGVFVDEARLVRVDATDDETILWQGGMEGSLSAVRASDGSYIVSSPNDNALFRVTTDARIQRLFGGLKRPAGITLGNDGNFYVTQLGDNSLVKVSATGLFTLLADGLNSPYDVKLDAQGNAFVADFGSNSIIKVASDGSKAVFAQGVARNPVSMRYDVDDNLYIVGNDGALRRKAADGSVSILTTGLSFPRGLAVDEDGSLLVVESGAGKVTRVTDGVKTTVLAGLSSPQGVAIDADHHVAITEAGADRLKLFDPSGVEIASVENLVRSPRVIVAGSGGDVIFANSGFLTKVSGGVGSRFGEPRSFEHLAYDPLSDALLGSSAFELRRIDTDGTTTLIKRTPFYIFDIAVDTVGNPVLLDRSGSRLVRIESDGTETVVATLPTTAQALLSDRAGNLYVQIGSNTLHRVLPDGTTAVLVSLPSDSIRTTTATADGRLLASMWSGKSLLIDPATALVTELPAQNVRPVAETITTEDVRVAIFDSSDVVFETADNDRIELGRFSGFSSPNDLVWTGDAFVFSESGSDLFQWTPGTYPQRMVRGFGRGTLAYANGLLLGSDGSAIYRVAGSTRQLVSQLTGAALSGVAVRGDGSYAGSDTSLSRVIEFDASGRVTGDFAGIIGPVGLAFASDGRLVVANQSSGTIVSVDADGTSRFVANVTSPEYLAFSPTGELWVTQNHAVSIVNADRTVTRHSSNVFLHGLLFDDTGTPIGVGRSDGTVRRWDGTTWKPIVSSLAQGPMVLDDAGAPVIAAESNRTVSRFADGRLQLLGSDIPFQPAGLARASAGELAITGSNGSVAIVDANGDVRDLGLQGLFAQATVLADVFESEQRSRILLTSNRVLDVRVEQATAPPPVGTVVHEETRAIGEVAPVEDYTVVDFGSWLPTFGGDFKVVVSSAAASGDLINFVHVGPSAQAALTATSQTLPPGDQSLRMCLDVSGADFTSLSRVEVSRIRPLVGNTRPNGMVADRAGNVYFTTHDSLNKTAADGTGTALAMGLNTAFGLAIDDNEVLYFPSRNAVSGRFDLMRASLDGTVAVFVPLDVSSANGVAVDSLGNVIVGTTGRLLKIGPDGTLTSIPTPGLPSPRGITIDGEDNVYAQNESGLVSMIRLDGTTFSLFFGSDGVENPSFEGDGFPNITADCASNVYIAPWQWSKINQSGEEHTLAQIIPRTGQVGALFDGRRVSSELTDIDYLSYDRFADRILMWQDFSNQIWQVPVTCGAIGVDAHLVTLPGQTLGGLSRGASAVVDLPGGSKEYVWSLRDVAAAGQAVCFDAPQSDLQLGELRQTLASGFMEFRNSFAPDNVRVPIAVPNVQVEDLIAITVGTDKAEYRANESVAITSGLLNSNVEPVSAILSVRVLDAQGAQVALVATQHVDLPAAGQSSAVHGFAVANLLPGQYRVVAELSRDDRLVASASADFMVLADDAPSSVSSRLATDKQVYDADEPVTILSRASNLSANVIRENLSLRIVVLDAGGATLATYSHFIAQLLPGASRDFSQVQQLGNVPAGAYRVEQQLLDADNRVLDVQIAGYQVRSGAESGAGVAGAIDATPNDLLSGAVATLNATVRNDGNIAIAALPVQVAVIDVQAQTVLASWPETLDLGLGAQRSLLRNWDSARVPAGEYLAVLSATFGGVDRVLAQATLHVANPDLTAVVSGFIAATPETPVVGEPVQLDAVLLNSGSVPLFDLPVRVQVLAADGTQVASWTQVADIAVAASKPIQNIWDSSAAVAGEYRVRLSLEVAGSLHTLDEQVVSLLPAEDPVKVETDLTRSGAARVLVLMTCGSEESDGRGVGSNDDDDDDGNGCVAARTTFLDAYLADLGVSHRIVTSTDDFEKAFRSGGYNVYWISGGARKLDNTLAEEVREAVFRGDGLIADGNHDSRNKTLDEALGVKHVGQLAHDDHTVMVGGSVFTNMAFVGRGNALRYELQGGTSHATFDSTSGTPALVGNVYGNGTALGFAFGLVPTLMQKPASADLRTLLLEGLGLVTPTAESIDTVGGFVAVNAEVRNIGAATDISLALSVDASAAIESTDPVADTADASTAAWAISVAEDGHERVVAGLRLPSEPRLVTVRLMALRTDDNALLAESEYPISVVAIEAVRDDLAQQLTALAVSGGKDRSARDNTIAFVSRAIDAVDEGRPEKAIENLLKARDQLVRITSAPIERQHQALTQLLRAIELRWYAENMPSGGG